MKDSTLFLFKKNDSFWKKEFQALKSYCYIRLKILKLNLSKFIMFLSIKNYGFFIINHT